MFFFEFSAQETLQWRLPPMLRGRPRSTNAVMLANRSQIPDTPSDLIFLTYPSVSGHYTSPQLMASLHDALQCLKPTSWEEVPQSPDELREYVCDIFKQSRLIAESLPDPPPYSNSTHGGRTPQTEPKVVVPSSARVGETDPELTSLQKQWGKPIKMGGPKDNPLGVHVWKLSANDGGGQWFGRRSVHEGMSFARWREKLSIEYDESLRINREKIARGETPDSSVRGIGAEEEVESLEVKGEDGAVLARVTVYHVSAQFPKPTAPRDFVTMIIASERGLRIGGTKQPGRSWMVVSRPCEHPGVPRKSGYLRGEYESVEMVREIPRVGTSSSSGSTSGEGQKGRESSDTTKERPDAAAGDNGGLEDETDEMNPVEWIMVTRSDPGGNIPRWMVDKGTPKSVGTDAAKFVEWAVRDDQSDIQEQVREMIQKDSPSGSVNVTPDTELKSGGIEDSLSGSDSDSTDTDQSHHGLIASFAGLLNTGLERFAPQSVLDYIPHQHESPRTMPEGDQASDKVARSSADSGPKDREQSPNTDYFTTQEPDHTSLSSARTGLITPAVEDGTYNSLPPAELVAMTKAGKLSSHEKELAKLALRKREVEAKLETVRSELERLQLPSQNTPSTPPKGRNETDSDNNSGLPRRATDNRSSTPASSGTQQSQRGRTSSERQRSSSNTTTQPQTPELPPDVHKAASSLFHKESKLLKQLRKIETNQLKVATKIEARQRKEAERAEKSQTRSEVEGLRKEVGDLKKEVSKLRSERQKWVDLVASLQAENTKLAARRDRS